MKLLDKLKNALFEEEYVEVEEKEERVKKEKPKKIKKESTDVKVTNYEENEEVVVARKIAPIKKEEKVVKSESLGREDFRKLVQDENTISKPSRVSLNDYDVPILSNNTNIKVTEIEEERVVKPTRPAIFNQENYESYEERIQTKPSFSKEIKRDVERNSPDASLYKTNREEEYIKRSTANEYCNYEKSRVKKVFKPSPNISPIYGIIDDNVGRVREPIRKEVRLTSAIRNDRVGVHDVRRKAYGTLVDDLSDNFSYSDEESERNNNLLIDLRENNAPEVNRVTISDAEEYFEDLGLQYDTDYIDASKAKASGKRLKSDSYDSPRVEEEKEDEIPSFLQEDDLSHFAEESLEPIFPPKEEHFEEEKKDFFAGEQSVAIFDNKTEDDATDDDNLFDLIDSMYDK